jgi:hypothetical protein
VIGIKKILNMNFKNDYFLKIKTSIEYQNYTEFVLLLNTNYEKYDIDYLLKYCSVHGSPDFFNFLIKKGSDIISNNECFLNICSNGKIDHLKILIKYEMNINFKYGLGLILACKNNHYNIVKFLINNGCNAHIYNHSVFPVVCKTGNLRMAKFLINQNVIIKPKLYQSIFNIIKYDNPNILNLILNLKINIYNIEKLFKIALEYSRTEIIKMLIDKVDVHYNNNEFYNFLIQNRNKKLLNMLIEKSDPLKLQLQDIFSQNIPIKYKKKSIPKSLRNNVWTKYIGDFFYGECYCCNIQININTWECGHIISEKNGGNTVLTNLRPVCSQCNKSMGTENMFIFKKKFK